MTRFLTISTRGCGQNRRHSQSRARAHACQAKNAHSIRRILHLCALALEKLAPSHQQAARLHTCQWRRSRLWPSSYSTARVFRRIRSNIYFVRTPKCSRQIQANEKGNRPALTSLNETRFLSYKPGGCGWAHAGSRDTKKAPRECMAPRSPMAEPKSRG